MGDFAYCVSASVRVGAQPFRRCCSMSREPLRGNLQTSVRVVLPWPASQCWPNRTKNRFARQKARKEAREQGYLAAFQSRLVLPAGKLLAVFRFYPPARRGFDLDNAHAAMKGAIDGVFEVCGRDDGDIDAALSLRCSKRRGGRVIIEFHPVEVVESWLHLRPSALLD